MNDVLELEARVLGSMLLDDACIPHVSKIVETQDFHAPHNDLFALLLESSKAGLIFGGGDLNALVHELKARCMLERVGGFGYLARLLACVPTSALALDYAKRVRTASIERQLREEVGALAAYMERDNIDPAFLRARLSSASSYLDAQMELAGTVTHKPPGFVGLADVKGKVRARLNATGGETGWGTGWGTLDRLLGGWRPGETTIITAHTGAGKSTFASQAALYQRLKHGRVVFFAPFEGGYEAALPKLVRQSTGNDPRPMTDETFDACVAALGTSEEWIGYDHIGAIEPARWRRALKYAVEEMGATFVVADHLHFMVERHDPELLAKLAQITAETVEIIAASNAHCLLVAQSKQNADKTKNRDDYVPQMTDIKGLTSIIQDVPNVISMYRPRDRKRDGSSVKNADGTLQAAAIVLKCRGAEGTEGGIRLRYAPTSERYLIDPRDAFGSQFRKRQEDG